MKKSEKGSVTLIVLVTVLFIVIILSSFLVYINSRRRVQLRETEEIAKAYDGNMEEIYNKRKITYPTPKIDRIEYVSGPDKKEYYGTEDIDYTGLKVRIIYDDGTASEEIDGAPYASSTVNYDFQNGTRHIITVNYNGIEMNKSIETYKKGWYSNNVDGYFYYTYFTNNGQMLIGGDYYLPNEENSEGAKDYCYFYFKEDGTLLEGWRQDGDKWYFYRAQSKSEYAITDHRLEFTAERWKTGSKITETGWLKTTEKWYYFIDGVMQVGWLQTGGYWYYLKGNGVMAEEEWIQYNGNWYYLKKGGVMAQNESCTINGKEYNFDSNGVCTNP